MTTLPAMGDDQRLELAAAAARARRANEPRALFLFSLVLVAGALLVLSFAWQSYARAAKGLREEEARARSAASKVAELRALQAAGSEAGAQANEPISKFRSRIERAGVEAGLKDQVKLPEESRTPDRKLGTQQVFFTYDLHDPSLEALMRFMHEAVAEVPGLEVHTVFIKPEPATWQLKVKFSRWERLEGT